VTSTPVLSWSSDRIMSERRFIQHPGGVIYNEVIRHLGGNRYECASRLEPLSFFATRQWPLVTITEVTKAQLLHGDITVYFHSHQGD
jgi:hypothetical protein